MKSRRDSIRTVNLDDDSLKQDKKTAVQQNGKATKLKLVAAC